MYKETIKYLDFNGVEREEDFYFHLTEAETIKYIVSEKGELADVIDKMIKAESVDQMLNLFERFVRMAYGERSTDGRYFTKTTEATERFISSEAYSNLFKKFLQDADYAAKFINGTVTSIKKNPDHKAVASIIADPTN